jgi:hypothetical protein
MGIETGNYINDLDADWPLATDNVSDGDNHLRLIKKVIKASFPGVDRVSEYIYVNTAEPTVSVGKGRLWLNTSTTPNLLYIYDGSNFKKLPISATVDYKLMGNDTVGWVLPTADGTANYPLTTTGSNVLAFAQIATAAIADNAVDGAKIAMGSDAAGDVLYHNGTDYVRLAKPGTPAGEVLTFVTSASAPSWTVPTGTVLATTHARLTGNAVNRSATYIDSGLAFSHTKTVAASDLYINININQETYSNFTSATTMYVYAILTNSSGTIITDTNNDQKIMGIEDVGQGTGVTWDSLTGWSWIYKVTNANCPSPGAGSQSFKIYTKLTNASDMGSDFSMGSTCMIWEIAT